MSTPLTSVRTTTTLASRVADYVEIAKPRISVMVLITVSVGFALGSFGAWDSVLLVNALIGIALVATASSAFNQVIERHSDSKMDRTANRPIPSGRMSAAEVASFGAVCGVSGVVWLAASVNLVTTLLTALTFVLYVIAYTPLKSRSYLCTTVGAVPGALPPVLGWTAAGAPLDERALALFGILFLWQFPHFLAIAYLHRDAYQRAGLKMLPGGNVPRMVGWLANLSFNHVVACQPHAVCCFAGWRELLCDGHRTGCRLPDCLNPFHAKRIPPDRAGPDTYITRLSSRAAAGPDLGPLQPAAIANDYGTLTRTTIGRENGPANSQQ